MTLPYPVTQLLQAAGRGDEGALQRLYEAAYAELLRLARQVRDGRAGETLNTTALVHEAYLKLASGEQLVARDRIHFFRIAARAMRQVLVDAARRRATRARNEPFLRAQVEGSHADRLSADVLALEEALAGLEALNPRHAEVVECRFFAGLSVEETAMALAISEPTVKRDWRVARAWLASALHDEALEADGAVEAGTAPPRGRV